MRRPDICFIHYKESAGVLLLTCDDLTEQLLWSVPKERHTAHQELIQDDAHRPPVHRLPITLTENDLWGDILWSPAHLKQKQSLIYCTHIVISDSVRLLSQHSFFFCL